MKDWSKENSESRKDYFHQYHVDNVEKKKQAASDWYYDNYDYARVQHKNYYETHPEIRLAYYQTEKYKINHRLRSKEQKAKRRNLGFVKLFNNPFPDEVDMDMHHINDILVIPMPKKIHNICSHPEEHRERCNAWLYYLYGIDINTLLRE